MVLASAGGQLDKIADEKIVQLSQQLATTHEVPTHPRPTPTQQSVPDGRACTGSSAAAAATSAPGSTVLTAFAAVQTAAVRAELLLQKDSELSSLEGALDQAS